MRIEIKTNERPVTDKDIRGLYIIAYALENSTPRMRVENLAFFADRMGYILVPKKEKP